MVVYTSTLIKKEIFVVPNIKSQVKRVEVSKLENARNTTKKTQVKTAIKKFNAAILAKDLANAEILFRDAESTIMSSDLYQKNTIGRKVATLAKALDALRAEVKPVEAAPAKKTTRKKAEPKAE